MIEEAETGGVVIENINDYNEKEDDDDDHVLGIDDGESNVVDEEVDSIYDSDDDIVDYGGGEIEGDDDPDNARDGVEEVGEDENGEQDNCTNHVDVDLKSSVEGDKRQVHSSYYVSYWAAVM